MQHKRQLQLQQLQNRLQPACSICFLQFYSGQPRSCKARLQQRSSEWWILDGLCCVIAVAAVAMCLHLSDLQHLTFIESLWRPLSCRIDLRLHSIARPSQLSQLGSAASEALLPDGVQAFVGDMELLQVQRALVPLLMSHLPGGCVSAVSAALRHRWQQLPFEERALLPKLLKLLTRMKAGPSGFIAATLSAGSVPALGAGLTRQQAQAAFGNKTMWNLVELQQLASIESLLRNAVTKRRSEVTLAGDDATHVRPSLPPGLADLGITLFTSHWKQSGSAESLILFFAQKASELRQGVEEEQPMLSPTTVTIDVGPSPSSSHGVAVALATEVFVPLADLMGLWKIKNEIEDACFALTHATDRSQLLVALTEKGGGEGLLRLVIADLRRALDPYVTCEPPSASGELLVCGPANTGESLPFAGLTANTGESLPFAGLTELRVTGRSKSAYSTWRKMQRKGVSLDKILDRTAIRVIVDGETPAIAERLCYEVRALVAGLWHTLEDREKDYIASPKKNGYRSLHLAAERDGLPVEVQIRSKSMHQQAEYGSCGHWEYKAGASVAMSDAAVSAGAELFADMDEDGNGQLDASELQRALAQVGVVATPEEVEAMLDVFDADHDGTVTFTDFWRALVSTWFPLVSGTHKPRRQP